MCSVVFESLIRRMCRRKGIKVSAAMARKLSSRQSRNFQSGALMSAANGFRPNEWTVTRQPRREECFRNETALSEEFRYGPIALAQNPPNGGQFPQRPR